MKSEISINNNVPSGPLITLEEEEEEEEAVRLSASSE